VLGLFLVQSLCSSGPRVRVVEEACWVYVYKAVVGFCRASPDELSTGTLVRTSLLTGDPGNKVKLRTTAV